MRGRTKMKIGCCVKDVNEAKIAQEAGYDFVECTVVSLLPEEDETSFQEIMDNYQKLSIPVEVCNVFLPGDLKVVGEFVDHNRIKRYVASALKRVKKIGVDTIVFGSGNARNIPEGFPRDKAEKQIVEFLQIVAEYAEKFGLTIVIEPLNRNESNIINSVSEGVSFARKVNNRFIQVLADFYHMDEEKEPLTEIIKYRAYLKHIHVADTSRHQPGTGYYPYSDFSQCIKQAGYNGRVSIESIWTDNNLDEFKSSLKYLKGYLDDSKRTV